MTKLTPPAWRSEYPFASRWLDQQGFQYHYIDEGSNTDSGTLLPVHGNPTWSFYWRHLALAFRDRMRVVAVDHMGCGLSDKPQQYSYTLEQHRDNLIRLIEELNLQKITLVVHDWGGAIGLSAAVAMPQRFSRIVVLNSGAFPPPYIPWRIAVCRWPWLGTAAVRGGNLFSRGAISMAMNRRALDSSAVSGLLAPYRSWHDRVAVNRFIKDIPMRPQHPTYTVLAELEQRLPDLSGLPIQIIWGMRDWCFRPECLKRYQGYWPMATTLEIADAGHYVMEDAREQVIVAIEEFFQRNPISLLKAP